jgi:subtilisin family serine protease
LPRRGSAGLFANRPARKRKSYVFEHLEERLAFTATPIETTSLSNDTVEGAAAILMRELQWAALQSADASAPQIALLQLPTDTYFPNLATNNGVGQWHLWNIGQEVGNPDFQSIFGVPGEDIDVIDVWQGIGLDQEYTGEGVLVAVIDNGVQTNHPDLIGNMHPTFAFNALDGTNDVLPDIFDIFGQVIPGAHHGTAVAGLIGATWSRETFVTNDTNGDGEDDDDDDDGDDFGGASGGTTTSTSVGGVGVAPEVTIVPILMVDPRPSIFDTPTQNDPTPIGRFAASLRYAMMVGVDITNNSWGRAGVANGSPRVMSGPTPAEIQLLRDTVIFGREGLGMIHVFASGNNGGQGNSSPGFPNSGNWSSAAYNGFVNSRYTIGVAGIDHDGQYSNADGTVTAYAMAGPSVLVAAPTGSNVAQDVADDAGQGSGLWTTDLVGDFGANAATDPNTGIDDDRDFVADPDYTSRFNGTSAAAPIVTGVIALMLDANPNLTYRDVQEILVRSSRQAAQFEFPSNGAGSSAFYNSWQTNPMIPFRDPDAWDTGLIFTSDMLFDPIADPTLDSFPYSGSIFGSFPFPFEGNDFQRQQGHYELQPPEFTNGAGYTVSQGYGTYGELIGYGHGVVDAELAVQMAENWHTLNQDIAPNTERTFTTFINPIGDPPFALPPAERGSDDIFNILIPGGIQRQVPPDTGFAGFWNEYAADPPAPFDPANSDSWPENNRGFSYIDFRVPVNQQINVEWVEVKLSISGPPEDLDYLKINLTSPNGMQSELNHYTYDPTFFGPGVILQDRSEPATGWSLDTPGDLTGVWTWSTNRNWGESTNAAVIMNPLTGEPVAGPGDFDFTTGTFIPQPIFRDWELHFENWSDSTFFVDNLEIVWHGKPIAGGQLDQDWEAFDPSWDIPVAQRIQGFVGIDVDDDDEFSGIDPLDDNEWNDRYIQNFFGFDPDAPRQTELQRRLLDDFQDNNFNGVFDEGDVREMEPYAANVLVEAFRYTPGASGDPADDVVETQPIAQFLTGADGNYYFDLLPGNYIIRATDLNINPGTVRDDPNTPLGFRMHYQEEWRINEDWFYAPDRDVMTPEGRPGEIFQPDRDEAPTAFQFDPSQPRIPAAIKDLNFLLKPSDALPTPPNTVVVNGTVYADVNGNAAVDVFDVPAGSMRVYYDSIRNGQFDPGEQFVTTNPDGTYSITIATAQDTNFTLGVDVQPGWAPSAPGGDLKTFFNGPGDIINGQDFFLNPPDDPTGSGFGNITGFVFNDIDGDGIRDPGENGISSVTVFIDEGVDPNGVLDAGEVSVITGANGGYFIPNLAQGSYQIDVVSTPEQLQTPEFRTVNLASGETRIGVAFGLKNEAFRDFGDLPATFDVNGFPSHVVVPHFRLGETIDGEVAASSGGDDTSDDGVEVTSNSGTIKPGDNRIEVQVLGAGGRLTGWIDWSGDGVFQSEEQITFLDPTTGEVLGLEADLSPSPDPQELRFDLPEAPGGSVAARFRWGEVGLSLNSQSFIGEVEDYIWPSTVSVVAPPLAGDFNQDGGVNAADYVLLRKFMGGNLPPLNSSTPSSPVVPADQAVWETNFGATAAPVVVPPQPGDFNTDGDVNAADYVAFRKFVGTGTSLPNTTNPDDPVVPADQELWETNFGASADSGGSAAVSSPANYAATGGASPAAASETNSTLSLSTRDSNSSNTSAAASLSFSPGFVGTLIDVGSMKSVASTVEFQSDSPASDKQATANALLLLDQAMAELDENDDDAPLADRKGDDDGYDDLALAAVFDDESAWWSV